MPAAPQRTCAGCRALRPKAEMLRMVRQPNGTVGMDPKGRSEGRGAYICPKANCLDAAVKRRAFERGLKGPVPNEAIEMMRAAVTAAP